MFWDENESSNAKLCVKELTTQTPIKPTLALWNICIEHDKSTRTILQVIKGIQYYCDTFDHPFWAQKMVHFIIMLMSIPLLTVKCKFGNNTHGRDPSRSLVTSMPLWTCGAMPDFQCQDNCETILCLIRVDGLWSSIFFILCNGKRRANECSRDWWIIMSYWR